MNELSVLAVGFVLGMKHATEADHLAAVATLATRHTSLLQIMRQGVAWGVGHTLVLLVVGGFVLALGKAIPARTSEALELAVGVMLLALGADVLRRVSRTSRDGRGKSLKSAPPVRARIDERDPTQPTHIHGGRVPGRALAIGMIHGMAGSAALVLLGLAVAPTVASGIFYIAVFGLGSILGMALLSALIAVPLSISARWMGWLRSGMNAAIGTVTCGLGILIVYRVGVAGGLLQALFA